MGVGILYSASNFPVLAPVTPAQQPFAVSFLSFEEGSPVVPVVVTDCRRCRLTEGLQSEFYGFTRAFGQVFGIAIGSTILQNRLNELLPAAFLERFGSGEIAFAAIPVIKTL